MIRYYTKLLIKNTYYVEILSLMFVLGLIFTGLTLSDGQFQASNLPDRMYLPFFFNHMQTSLNAIFLLTFALLMAIPYGKLSMLEKKVMPFLISRYSRSKILRSRCIVIFISTTLLLLSTDLTAMLCTLFTVKSVDFHSYASYIISNNDPLLKMIIPYTNLVCNHPLWAMAFYIAYTTLTFGLLGTLSYLLGKLIGQIQLTYILAFLIVFINHIFTNKWTSLLDTFSPYSYQGGKLSQNIYFLTWFYPVLLFVMTLFTYHSVKKSMTP